VAPPASQPHVLTQAIERLEMACGFARHLLLIEKFWTQEKKKGGENLLPDRPSLAGPLRVCHRGTARCRVNLPPSQRETRGGESFDQTNKARKAGAFKNFIVNERLHSSSWRKPKPFSPLAPTIYKTLPWTKE